MYATLPGTLCAVLAYSTLLGTSWCVFSGRRRVPQDYVLSLPQDKSRDEILLLIERCEPRGGSGYGCVWLVKQYRGTA